LLCRARLARGLFASHREPAGACDWYGKRGAKGRRGVCRPAARATGAAGAARKAGAAFAGHREPAGAGDWYGKRGVQGSRGVCRI